MSTTTSFGSKIERTLTCESLQCFESMNLDSSWRYLASADPSHHAVWVNEKERSLLEFSEGDITVITAPDEFIFNLELAVQVEFADAQR